MLLALEVLSCQHALVGLPEDCGKSEPCNEGASSSSCFSDSAGKEHINKLLKKLGVQDDGEETFIAVD